MDQRRLLIADSSEDFCRQLQSILRWVCEVHICTTGSKALTMLSQLHPDVLVLDLMLPELDGISLLKALSLTPDRPLILATTCLATDYILEAAEKLDVRYLLMKPCSIRATAARIQEQLDLLDRSRDSLPDLPLRISGLLLMMGFSVKLHGFRYLQEAILQMLANPDQSITKELYPSVGALYDTAGSHVERSIRGAIEDAWNRRDEQLWQLYFPQARPPKPRKPTNAAFIARLADGLRISRSGSTPIRFIEAPPLDPCLEN